MESRNDDTTSKQEGLTSVACPNFRVRGAGTAGVPACWLVLRLDRAKCEKGRRGRLRSQHDESLKLHRVTEGWAIENELSRGGGHSAQLVITLTRSNFLEHVSQANNNATVATIGSPLIKEVGGGDR